MLLEVTTIWYLMMLSLQAGSIGASRTYDPRYQEANDDSSARFWSRRPPELPRLSGR